MTITFRFETFRSNTTLDEVYFYCISSVLRKLNVLSFLTSAISVTFDTEAAVREFLKNVDNLVQYLSRFELNSSFTSVKQDSFSILVQAFLIIIIRFWTTFVACRTSYFRAKVIFVKNTITICIRPRTSTIFSRTSYIWTFVIFVCNTITVSIRTSVEFFWTSYFRTSIIFVSNTISISIRTSIEFF